jgi:hypothetical protein
MLSNSKQRKEEILERMEGGIRVLRRGGRKVDVEEKEE